MRSSPAGAAVFLNGRLVGTTPVVLTNQSAGSRAVRLTLDGYDTWTSAVRVIANEQIVVNANLRSAGTRD